MSTMRNPHTLFTAEPILRFARTAHTNIDDVYVEIAKSIVVVALIVAVAEVAAIALVLG